MQIMLNRLQLEEKQEQALDKHKQTVTHNNEEVFGFVCLFFSLLIFLQGAGNTAVLS